MLADSHGRKFVIFLGLFGSIVASLSEYMTLSLYNVIPYWTIYIYPLFLWIGGGGFVVAAVMSAIVTDVVTKEHRFVALRLQSTL